MAQQIIGNSNNPNGGYQDVVNVESPDEAGAREANQSLDKKKKLNPNQLNLAGRPKREDFPPGLAGIAAYNAAIRAWQASQTQGAATPAPAPTQATPKPMSDLSGLVSGMFGQGQPPTASLNQLMPQAFQQHFANQMSPQDPFAQLKALISGIYGA